MINMHYMQCSKIARWLIIKYQINSLSFVSPESYFKNHAPLRKKVVGAPNVFEKK